MLTRRGAPKQRRKSRRCRARAATGACVRPVSIGDALLFAASSAQIPARNPGARARKRRRSARFPRAAGCRSRRRAARPALTSVAAARRIAACFTRISATPSRRLPPLEIGIAPQRAEPAARRVDEHAVDLAGEALHLGVVLAAQQMRMQVRKPRALQPRLQPREPRGRDVERVDAALRMHHRAEHQRFAAGAGAEIDDELVAARRDEIARRAGCLRPALRPRLRERAGGG